ncbi:TMEM14 family protein [Mastigocladopsis repens]|uniref:TMEM14 family protein n=1 Tax=Mastigocladopsis repens TaxID=221287 RepID=UPI000314656B|nr:TMEM14 family protein [Mastigocladopsis repens]
MTLGVVAALAYGILAIVGGIIGYRKANSKVSLVSGSLSGLLLIIAAFVQLQGQTWGLILAAVVTAILVVFFALRVTKTRKFMPAGLMAILGVVALATMVNQLAVLR